MKIAVIGAGGMLGKDVVSLLRTQGYSVAAYGHESLDVTDREAVLGLRAKRFDIVINCAAYTKVDKAEDDQESYYQVNVLGVRNLIDLCITCDATLVQISTDYVFDGSQSFYGESDRRNPLNYYGKTKAEAEELIESFLHRYYVVRTSWLFGHGGKNFVETVIERTRTQGMMKIVNDQRGCPTYTVDLVNKLAELFLLPYGIYHVTNSGSCTWYEFAVEIVHQAKIVADVQPCTSEDFVQRARRPKSSVLQNNGKISPMRSWQSALQDYLSLTKS